MLFRGVVQKGEQRGRMLGFPTANIPYDGTVSGIFAAVARVGSTPYNAAVYADTRRKFLEAHLEMYTEGDLYGRDMEIELLQKIREDRQFDSETDLKAAIAADIQAVRLYFKERNSAA